MEYRSLGRTGLKISRLGLGGGNWGGIGSAPALFGKGESEEEAFALMDAACDLGINFIDTADAYGGGRSETALGKWLKSRGSAVRDSMLVSSKVFYPVGEGPNDRGLSRRHIRRQVEASLRRLGIDHLDLYLIHEPDPETPLEETLGALDDLVHAGKVHYLGASNVPAWRLAKALGIAERRGFERFAWVQCSYSLLDRAAERELFPLCAEEGLGVTPYSPIAGGWLSGKYRFGESYPEGSRMSLRPEPYLHLTQEKTFRALDAFRKAAEQRGVTLAALAIAWVLAHPQVTAVIVGPRRPEQLDDARAALDIGLSASERLELSTLFA
jgi:aryl-alcohol dehydrogenase-like predicted oxidoreductase